MTGVPFLTAQLGAAARLAVEVAWGADLSAASSTWAWTDITTDVRMNPGISLKHGRADEASKPQPASCKLTLDNSTGAYSLGGQSPNWPYVRQNTPLRVSVDVADGTGFHVLFIGYADAWQPVWTQDARVADVKLTASGILRRLGQQAAPVQSSLRRKLQSDPTVVAYWPLEADRKATTAPSAIPGKVPMTVTGEVDFAGDTTSFDCALQAAVVKGGTLTAHVDAYPDTHQWQVRVLVKVPDNGQGMVANLPILSVSVDDPAVKHFEILYTAGGGLQLNAFDAEINLVFSSGPISFAVDGRAFRLFFQMQQNGPDVDWTFGTQFLDNPAALVWSGTQAGQTLGRLTTAYLCTHQGHSGLSLGHYVAQDTVTSIFDDYAELSAFLGEKAVDRFRRLCDENGIEHIEWGDGTTGDTLTDLMGVQRPGKLLDLLNETIVVDQGMIVDGEGTPGLVWLGRRFIENRPAQVTIDVSAAGLGGVLGPIHDDQGRLNKASVTRQDGATATVEDADGPQGTATVGIYDGALTVNCESDDAALQYASWLVALGTTDGYRYPTVELDLAANPGQAPAWATTQPGVPIMLTNVDQAVPQHPDGDVLLTVQGYSQTLTTHSWTASVNCSPGEPWWLPRVAQESGDIRPTVWRPDTDGSTLSAAATAGAGTLTVATTSGAVWTTDPDDFPFDITVGGIPITVTGIAGTSSPQTFTVDSSSVTKDLPSGLSVGLDHARPLGL